MFQAERDAQIKRTQQEQEEHLAEELAKLKLEKGRDEKMRQQIRENW